jgi:parallel beta-helix repeat protein
VKSKRSELILMAAVLTVSIFFTWNGAAATEIIVHNGESIQQALDRSVSGDTITIEAGVYKEKLSTYTGDLLIQSESANPDDVIIEGPGITIWASNVTIKGFTIKGAADYSGIAIINRTGNCQIKNNKISNYISGIEIPTQSTLNIVSNNEISDCQEGITVFEGIIDNIKNNKISNCENGITFREGDGNLLSGNEISNCDSGITYMEGFENTVSGNRISACKSGVNIGNGDATLLENRTLVENNTITENEVGISVNGAAGGGYTISRNTISLNEKCGYEDYSAGTNLIYDNYFNNTLNVRLGEHSRPETPSSWNITKTPGKNIVGGPYIGGNYWATPEGNGFSQTHSDSDADGTFEGPYSLNKIEADYLPLVLPSKNSESRLPIADFSSNVTGGLSPLSVQFKDLSRYATQRSWDFENDGKIDSKDKNVSHIFTGPGIYIVNLTVKNENGVNSKLAIIKVLEKPSSVLPTANLSANVTQGNTKNQETQNGSRRGNSEGKAHVLSSENKLKPDEPGKDNQTTYTENETFINPLIENGNRTETPKEDEDLRSDQEKNPKILGFQITFGLLSLIAAFAALFMRKMG